MLIVSKTILNLLTGRFADSITIWPIIFIRSSHQLKYHTLINHERIHLRQQIELLIIFFYLWYFIEYLMNRIKSNDHFTAYRNIRFEKEAYDKESDLGYLKKRKYFAFLQY
ncbi:MAG: hypothetical protein ABI851_14055 [Saprospiraceae bacterium]